jgi:hypothetical protein
LASALSRAAAGIFLTSSSNFRAIRSVLLSSALRCVHRKYRPLPGSIPFSS